jgi:thiamine-phosphate pyrophosphorylase
MLMVVTMPDFFEGEYKWINLLFRNGLQRLHLRKPSSSLEDYKNLLSQIEPQFRPLVVLHDHFQLALEYRVYGIHINSRNNVIPSGFCGSVSRSLHSVDELLALKNNYNYVTLSPIFDSVSKQGYNSAFSAEQLKDLSQKGIIDSRVVALGGVTSQNIKNLKSYGFGGAMVLGSLWQNINDEHKFLEEFRLLQD